MAHTLGFAISALLLASCVASNSTATYDATNTDRLCGGTLANLWLDVVIVIENTAGMTQKGLTQAAANAAAVFLNGTKIGTQGYSDPRTTRVAIATYDTESYIKADLNAFQSIDDLVNGIFNYTFSVSNKTDAYVSKGLYAAEQILKDGRANGYRNNYQQMVVVYAASYKDGREYNPKPVADRLKDGKVKIVTVAFSEGGGDLDQLKKLGELASPGFSFSNTDLQLVGEIQGAALQTNCFCQDEWTQYRSDVKDPDSFRYGVCLFTSKIQTAGTLAKLACNNLVPDGYLATEFSQQKHDYIYELVQQDPTISAPYIYFIGLTYANGGWYWQQPAGWLLKPLQWTDWNPGYPITPYAQNTAVLNQQFGNNQIGWVNANAYTVSKNYVCEVASCDTETYCA